MAVIKQIQVGTTPYDLHDKYASVFINDAVGTAAKTSSPYYCAIWDVENSDIASLYDGLRITIKVPVGGNSTYGTAVRINSSSTSDLHPVVYNVSSMIGSRYSVNAYVEATYDSTQTATLYINSSAATTVTGCWKVMDYDANTQIAYGTLDYYLKPYVGSAALYRYKYVVLDKDNRIVPITTTDQTSTTQVAKAPTSVAFRPDKIWYYNSTDTVQTGNPVANSVLVAGGYHTTGAYNFNATIAAYRLIYLRGTYNRDTGLFTLYNDNSSPCKSYYTQVPDNTANITLSDYFVSGYNYILLGASYSSNNAISLFANNVLYYFDGTNLVRESMRAPTAEITAAEVQTACANAWGS